MENTEKKTYTVEEIIKGADWISSACPHEAAMLRQFAEMLKKGKKRYVVTRVDGDYCPVCEIFDTWDAAEAFVKADFEKCGFCWGNRFSMTDAKSFPFRESVDGNHEWDIHEKEIA